ncbi:MAG TPA: HNH endonuclease signature motif containing protein [Jiangellales bacterium]|nr:HNH endonuclease signature motif containing protein [Jiangellales bacterium]
MAGDEMCEIAGVGPVPVEVARGLLGDAVLKLVITRGVDVLNVTHLGRGPTAAQRVALAWQSPTCAVEGCWRRRVEIDHREEWARTRHTRLDELDPLCAQHHDLKTRFGWALVRGTGKRPFVPPSDSRHPRHQQQRDGRAGDSRGRGDTSGPGDAAGYSAPGRPVRPTPVKAAGRSGEGRPVRPTPGEAVGSDRPGPGLVQDGTTARSDIGSPFGEAGATRTLPSDPREPRTWRSVGRERRGDSRSAVTAPLFEDGLA